MIDTNTSLLEFPSQTSRKTYPQNWPAYNAAQTSEKNTFMVLLGDLCANVPQPEYVHGRPRFPLADMVYTGAIKVYSGFSARRFDCDVRAAAQNGYIDSPPSFNTVNRYIADPQLTSILKKLVEISAAPLNLVEQNVAADSSGFSTGKYERWFDAKWGKERSRRQWLKAHIMTGVRTNIVTAVTITPGNANDSPVLPKLLDDTAQRFEMTQVSADKAYLSESNLKHALDNGAFPYIPFKSNSSMNGRSDLWRKIYAHFLMNEEAWKVHYHKRSNVETTFSMVKGKFGAALRAKSEVGQTNEILLKFVCHNICVLIQEMHELGIEPDLSPRLAVEDRRN